MQTMKDNNKLLIQKVRDILEVNKELKRALSSKYKIGTYLLRFHTITTINFIRS